MGSVAGPRHSALADVLPLLRCPVCREPVELTTGRVVCVREHSFDLARQGYVNLTAGGKRPKTADTAPMVAARERFLGGGHYAPIAEALRACVAPTTPGIVLDLAGGTGYYLARVLDALPDRHGLCLDLSTAALRRAVHAHPRAAAIGSDAWAPLPLAEHSAAVVLSVFGPRNPAEIHRVLASGGLFVAVTPTTAHLAELIEPLGMLSVQPDKTRRLTANFQAFEQVAGERVTHRMRLAHDVLTDLVDMGPTAHHVAADTVAERVAALPTPMTVTASVDVSVYRATRQTTARECETTP